jgi:hypothetical protein
MTHRARRSVLALSIVTALSLALPATLALAADVVYFPPAGEWARKDPAGGK